MSDLIPKPSYSHFGSFLEDGIQVEEPWEFHYAPDHSKLEIGWILVNPVAECCYVWSVKRSLLVQLLNNNSELFRMLLDNTLINKMKRKLSSPDILDCFLVPIGEL